MTVNGPQTPVISPNINTVNSPALSPHGKPAVQQSTRSFLNELARAVSTQTKNETRSTQSIANTSTALRSGVFSPASIGAAAPAFGSSSASGGKATAKKRSARKKTPVSPSKLS